VIRLTSTSDFIFWNPQAIGVAAPFATEGMAAKEQKQELR
jgi:hypothetical protein